VQIPFVGEILALSTDSAWYKLELVVHTPFPCGFDAEVYAVEVGCSEITKQAFGEAQKTSYVPNLARHTRYRSQRAKRIHATGKRYLLSDDPSERDRGKHILSQVLAYVRRGIGETR